MKIDSLLSAPGRTLRRWIETTTLKELEEISEATKDKVKELHEVHGIVHGDLNLENIMVNRLPGGGFDIEIIDFGKAGFIGKDASKMDAEAELDELTTEISDDLTAILKHQQKAVVRALKDPMEPASQDIIERYITMNPSEKMSISSQLNLGQKTWAMKHPLHPEAEETLKKAIQNLKLVRPEKDSLLASFKKEKLIAEDFKTLFDSSSSKTLEVFLKAHPDVNKVIWKIKYEKMIRLMRLKDAALQNPGSKGAKESIESWIAVLPLYGAEAANLRGAFSSA